VSPFYFRGIVMDIMKRFNAKDVYMLSNKVRGTVDGKVVVLARLYNDTWVLTDEGKQVECAEEVQEAPAPVVKTNTRKSKK